MPSFLDFEGVYDKNKRYVVHNWSKEDFTQHFGEESIYNENNLIVQTPPKDITIKAGEMREFGQFEAYTFTKHFVNREMLREVEKIKDLKERERKEMSINIAELRKPYENKTLSEIKSGEESPMMEKLREEIRNEEIAKLKQGNKPTKETKGNKEFEGLE